MMKVLIIGGSGLLGTKLYELLNEKEFDVCATFFQNRIKKNNFFEIDITKKDEIDFLLKKISPDVVVHTAAFTNVDGCEKNKEKALLVNAKGTENIALASEKNNAKFVYISTDYVFDGMKGCYDENNVVNPINYYGFSKLEGEQAVMKICSSWVIARTAVLFGKKKGNFVTWLIDALRSGKKVTIATDQFVSPTVNDDLSEQLTLLIEQDVTGMFHTAGGERLSRYEFALVVADIFDLDKTLIIPSKMEAIQWIAKRPRDSSLDVSKISKMKKPYMVKQAVGLLKEELEELV